MSKIRDILSCKRNRCIACFLVVLLIIGTFFGIYYLASSNLENNENCQTQAGYSAENRDSQNMNIEKSENSENSNEGSDGSGNTTKDDTKENTEDASSPNIGQNESASQNIGSTQEAKQQESSGNTEQPSAPTQKTGHWEKRLIKEAWIEYQDGYRCDCGALFHTTVEYEAHRPNP